MKENENILEKAVNSIKNEQISSGPSKELVDATLEKVTIESEQSNYISTDSTEKQHFHSKKFPVIKIAASIIILITAGYITARVSASKQMDIEKIRSELEPAIREKLLDEIYQNVRLDITAANLQLRQELTEQYRYDLQQNTLEILTTQLQEKQLIVAALQQLELNRLEDKSLLGNTLVSFALNTQQDIELIENFLYNDYIYELIPNENLNN